MRYLVTGCAGFIGSTLTDALLAAGHEVVGVDCFTDYYAEELKNRNLESARSHDSFSLLQLDLGEADLPAEALEVDGVFHQAAQAGVRASWGEEFRAYTDWNVLGTQRLLEQLTRSESATPPRVVYASSSSIYGNALARPTREDALPAPVSPYGVTKLAGEHLMATYSHNFGMPTVSLRYFTVYGPRQRPDMAFHRFLRAGLSGEGVTVYGDGSQSRDFTFVGDAVTANIAAMSAPDVTCEVCNIGGGTVIELRDALTLIGEVIETGLDVTYIERQRGDVRHTSADTSRARVLLGFEPAVDLREGLTREAEWMRQLLASPAGIPA